MRINERHCSVDAKVRSGKRHLGCRGHGFPLYYVLLAANIRSGRDNVHAVASLAVVILHQDVGVRLEDRRNLSADLELGVCRTVEAGSEGYANGAELDGRGGGVFLEVDDDVLPVVAVALAGRQVGVLVLGGVP